MSAAEAVARVVKLIKYLVIEMVEFVPPFFLCIMRKKNEREKFVEVLKSDHNKIRGQTWHWKVYGGVMLTPCSMHRELPNLEHNYANPMTFPRVRATREYYVPFSYEKLTSFRPREVSQDGDSTIIRKVDYAFRAMEADVDNGSHFILTPSMGDLSDPLINTPSSESRQEVCLDPDSNVPTLFIILGDGRDMLRYVHEFVEWLYEYLGVFPDTRQLVLHCDGMLGWRNIFTPEYLCGEVGA